MKKEIGIIMNGVTGRMGTNQHLARSIVALREQGGLAVGDDVIVPCPVLVGRNKDKLQRLAACYGIRDVSTNLQDCLNDENNIIYFDAQTTDRRAESVHQAIDAGKAIYCEKPIGSSVAEALALSQHANEAGVKHGVVQDKLWLPGFMKLKLLLDNDFFGKLFSVRGEFGYWVFDGHYQTCQRPSWNYRKEDGGSIIIDMLCHFQYIIENLFGRIRALTSLGATHVAKRWDENNAPYTCTADDASYTTFELANGTICHFNASWCVRVRRDDLLTLQIDGEKGSAVVGLRDCWVQPHSMTPKAVWNPDIAQEIPFFDGWTRMPDTAAYDNAFKIQWELFLQHVCGEGEFPYTLGAGVRGIQIAECALQSWNDRAWVETPLIV